MNQENWEKLVDTVDTVERGTDGELYVYFTLYALPFLVCMYLHVLTLKLSRRHDKERHRQTTTVCRKRFPQKVRVFLNAHCVIVNPVRLMRIILS